MHRRGIHQKTLVKRIKPLEGTYYSLPEEEILQCAIYILSQSVGKSIIQNFIPYESVLKTINCLQSLGITFKREDSDKLAIYGVGIRGLKKPKDILNIGSFKISGYFLIGIISTYKFYSIINGNERFKFNGSFFNDLLDHLKKIGTEFLTNDLPIIIKGTEYGIPNIYYLEKSSFYVKSALIMSGLNIAGRTTIIEQNSVSLDHAELMLKHLIPESILITEDRENKKVIINGLPEIYSQSFKAPGSAHAAVYLAVAAIILPNSEITIEDVCINPMKIKIYSILQKMGANLKLEETEERFGERIGTIYVKNSKLHGIIIKENETTIENLPILLILASIADGNTIIENDDNLKLLKNEKILNVIFNLEELGVKIIKQPEKIIIEGGFIEGGKEINVYNNFDTALSFIICSFAAKKPITICNYQSYWFNLFYNKKQ